LEKRLWIPAIEFFLLSVFDVIKIFNIKVDFLTSKGNHAICQLGSSYEMKKTIICQRIKLYILLKNKSLSFPVEGNGARVFPSILRKGRSVTLDHNLKQHSNVIES